jgi:hypothetical protein
LGGVEPPVTDRAMGWLSGGGGKKDLRGDNARGEGALCMRDKLLAGELGRRGSGGAALTGAGVGAVLAVEGSRVRGAAARTDVAEAAGVAIAESVLAGAGVGAGAGAAAGTGGGLAVASAALTGRCCKGTRRLPEAVPLRADKLLDC